MAVCIAEVAVATEAAFPAEDATVLVREVAGHFVGIGYGVLTVGRFRQILRHDAALIDKPPLVGFVSLFLLAGNFVGTGSFGGRALRAVGRLGRFLSH